MSDRTLATRRIPTYASPVKDVQLSLRFPQEVITEVDNYRAKYGGELTRTAALRLLILRGLDAEGEKDGRHEA